MIYNAVSSQAIIGKVYRDTTIDDPSFEYDAVEWMGEALNWIGAGTQYTDKEDWVVVNNHTGVLPSDLHYLKGVWVVNEAPLKDNWQDADFPYDLDKLAHTQKYKLERSDEQLHDGIGGASTDLQESNNFDSNDNWRTSFQELQGNNEEGYPVNTVGYETQENYHLNGNQIKTSFSEGLILVAYKGLPVDNDGYPLVPDDIAFKEALSWYIIKKLAFQKKVEIDPETAENRWLKRCTQARNRANFPDLDEYEKFLQSWTKMVETQRFNKGNVYSKIQDGRTDDPDAETYNYRVTEDGTVRITE